jgi:hypothetical protein
MLYALKQVQGKRHLRMRMEKSFKLLRERNEDAKDHTALIRVRDSEAFYQDMFFLLCIVGVNYSLRKTSRSLMMK